MATKAPKYLPSIGRLIGFAFGRVNQLSNQRLREHDVTIRQWVALSALWRTSPLSESELVAYTKMSASSLNRLLDRMEAKRLVMRAKDPADRRRTLVALGVRGRELSHLVSFYEDINKVIVDGFSTREQEQLVSLLERVNENVVSALSAEEENLLPGD